MMMSCFGPHMSFQRPMISMGTGFGFGALEDRPGYALHARFHLADGHDFDFFRLLGGEETVPPRKKKAQPTANPKRIAAILTFH